MDGMKLVVKLPKGKLPFIGILLPKNNLDSQKFNQDLILDYKYASYRIVFEFIRSHVNIKLISDESLIVRFYNKLEYNPEKLRAWFYLTNNAKEFNFSQIVLENGKEVVQRTYERKVLFVLKVNKYEIATGNSLSEKELPF